MVAKTVFAGWVLVFSLGVMPAAAQEEAPVDLKPLAGNYYLGPAVDAEDGAPADTFYATVTGDAAKAMWDAIKAKPTPDECVGRMAKWASSLVCYGPGTEMSGPLGPDESPFDCNFGIDLKKGSLSLGGDC